MARMKGGRGTMTEAECRAEIRKFFMELYPACTVIYSYPGNAARPPAPYVVLDFDAADSSQIDEYVDDGILQQTWYMSIYDADMQMKIGMAKLVPGAIWNFYYLNSNGPPGILGVQTDKERIGRQDFVDAVAHLYYLPAEQMGVQ